MNIRSSHAKILTMVQVAFLVAVEVVLTLLYIPVGAINLNFGLVPIVIAGVFWGPAIGGFIGAASGVVTMIQVLTGQSPFYILLVATNPFMASLLCIVKTGAAGVVSGALGRITRNKGINVIAASAACPIINTGIFALGMITIFADALNDALVNDPVISGWTTGGLFALVFGILIGANFFVEWISTVVITPVLSQALSASGLLKKK